MIEDVKPELHTRGADRKQQLVTPRQLAVMAVFVALSAVGALIKIPSPVGTVALDAAPGFFVAVGFAGWMGAVVAAIGHLLTSAMVGFPLSLPMHLIIAVGMAVCAAVFGWLGRRSIAGLALGFVLATLLNSVVLGLMVLPIGGVPMYVATMLSLLVGAVVNLAIATAAYLGLRNTRLLN